MSRPPQPVPSSLLRLARCQAGLVNLRQCHALGLTTRQVARRVDRGEWRRAARGVYETGAVRPTSASERYDLRRRRAAFLGPLCLPDSVVVGLGALVLHGVQGVPPGYRPEVTLPDATSRTGPGPVRVRRIPVAAPVVIDGVRCAPLAESLARAVLTLGRLDAVAVIDSALHQGLLAEPERARYLTARRRGVRRSWGWWDDADARAESPAESWARVTCQDRGFRPDAVQLWAVGAGRRSRVDLAWVLPDGSVLLVEVDGRDVHSSPDALYDDRHRQNRLITPRTIVRRFTGSDARRGLVAREVGSLLTEAGWTPRPVPDGVGLHVERHEWVPIRVG